MTDYKQPVSKPCNDCPFRRASTPGWLGRGSPESFLDCMQRGEPLPCHQTIDYDNDPDWASDWSVQRGDGKMCAGALVFMANKMQRPRDRSFPTMPPDEDAVFSNSIEFVRHHREAAAHSWDDADQCVGALLQRELVAASAAAMGAPAVDGGRDILGRVSGRGRRDSLPLQNIPVRSELGRQIRREFFGKPPAKKR